MVERSSINTQALIDAGQSLLVGGLVRESDANGVSKVPLFGDIPLLGALFRSTTRSATRVERMFLISPRLAERAPSTRRFDAPLLFGEESRIVSRAPVRTAAVNRGLARRDAAYPLVEGLPIGGADVDLRADIEPGAGVAPNGGAVPDDPLRRNDDRDPHAPGVSGPDAGAPVPWTPTPGDGWQAVGDDPRDDRDPARPVRAATESGPAVELAPAVALEPIDAADDGWQEWQEVVQ